MNDHLDSQNSQSELTKTSSARGLGWRVRFGLTLLGSTGIAILLVGGLSRHGAIIADPGYPAPGEEVNLLLQTGIGDQENSQGLGFLGEVKETPPSPPLLRAGLFHSKIFPAP